MSDHYRIESRRWHHRIVPAMRLIWMIITLLLSLSIGRAQTTTTGAGNFGSGVPPGCSNQMDFSQACNSQYLAIGGLL